MGKKYPIQVFLRHRLGIKYTEYTDGNSLKEKYKYKKRGLENLSPYFLLSV